MDEFTIESIRDNAFAPPLDAELRALLVLCFTDTDAFATKRYWHESPAQHWMMRGDDGQLIAHACIHDKLAGSDAGDLKIGGVAEVCVHPNYRRRGLTNKLLNQIHVWLGQKQFDFAMLFGRVEVYGPSGYVPAPNPLRHLDWETQQFKTEPITAAMVRPIARAHWPAGVIDLRGPIF